MTSPAPVCARCSQIKQLCDGPDGGLPCSRCVRLGHICQQKGLEKPNPNYRRPRASRSRSGCLSCKTRKKKCDEVRPRCGDCRRLNTSCRWPSGSPNQRPASPSGQQSSATSNALTLSALAASDVTDSSDGQSLLPDSPLFPDDGAISLPDITYQGFESEKSSLLAWPCSVNPHLRTLDDRSLFNHYLNTVARVLSRSGDQVDNPFLATLLPIAAASDTVTSVILGLSGCHWKRVYPTIWNASLARQGRALGQVNTLLGLPDPQSAVEACTTVLLLCLSELFDGSSRVWKWHLKAARTILESPTIKSMGPTAEKRFCVSLFHYLDAMSTISRCKPPLLDQANNMTDLTSVMTRRIPSVTESDSIADAVHGIPSALFDLLGRVNLLANHRSRRTDEITEIGFRAAAKHLEEQIRDWRTEHNLFHRPVNNEMQAATTAFESAVLLRLHQIVDGYFPQNENVLQCVTTILGSALQISYGSNVEGCLLFPLVIAGASSTEIERQMMVKERLMVMESTLGFSHIRSARRLLETVWEGGANAEPNWARVRYNHFPGIVFI